MVSTPGWLWSRGASPNAAELWWQTGESHLLATDTYIVTRWVVTAGHCVRDHDNIFNIGYTVILGEHTLMQKSEPLPRQKFTVSKVHIHPLYQQTPQADR